MSQYHRIRKLLQHTVVHHCIGKFFDGTAKGGVVFAIAHTLGIPIRFVGVGEALEDLRPFQAEPFVEALFDETRE